MATSKRACLVYVTATASMRAAARARLEAEGYDVCEVLADILDATAAESREASIPADLKACIDAAELCLFLLPENAAGDGGLGAGGDYASQLGKPFVAVVEGTRENIPQVFDADAAGLVHNCDDELAEAIKGDPSFKLPDGSNIADRKIKTIKCQ